MTKKPTTPWTPLEVARFDDRIVYIAIFEGEYHWHHHSYDEFFLVQEGEIIIQIKDGDDITLKAGECAVVPKGVEHCPKSDGRSIVLMVERVEL